LDDVNQKLRKKWACLLYPSHHPTQDDEQLGLLRRQTVTCKEKLGILDES